MTAPAPARALRIGVLLGDQLVEERVFARGTHVTFGQSLRCALSIPGDGIPREHLLFAPSGREDPARALRARPRRFASRLPLRGRRENASDGGRMLLRVTSGMEGRVAHGETIRTELRQGAGVDGVWTIPVERGMRGKLHVGDATILFQEMAAPPIAPRPVLPASIRGTLLDRVDRRLAVIIGGSIVAHLGLAAYAWMTDTEARSLLTPPLAMTYRHEMMEVTIPDEPTPTTAEPGPGAAAPATPVQTPRPIVDRPRVTTTASLPKPGLSPDDAMRFASILTGTETGRTGMGDMRNRQPGAELGAQIDDVGHRTVAIGDATTGFREVPGPRLGTTDGPIIDHPTQVTSTQPKTDDRSGGRIVIKPIPGEPPTGTTLTVQMVLDKITGAYMQGLQRCYKKGLVGDASLAGKVRLTFTVTERGTLEDATAAGVTPEVDGCIDGLMSSWRFSIPKDKDGDPTDASFKLGLVLQPT